MSEKESYTHIALVLDRSGSMQSIKDDTIGSFNAFLKGQKEVPGKATITMVQFDDIYEPICENIDIQECKELDDKIFVPRGMTALLDAIGKTIVKTDEFLKKFDHGSADYMTTPDLDNEAPEKLIFVILTDGQENSSKEYSKKDVMDMIAERSKEDAKLKWEILYLGADDKSIQEAHSLGIQSNKTMRIAKSKDGMQLFEKHLTANTRSYRTGGKADMSYETEQYSEMSEEVKKS